MDQSTRHAMLLAVIRAALYAAGTIAVALKHHWPDEAAITEIAGGLAFFGALAWSLWDKFKSESDTKAREHAAVNAGVQLANLDLHVITPPVSAVNVPEVLHTFKDGAAGI